LRQTFDENLLPFVVCTHTRVYPAPPATPLAPATDLQFLLLLPLMVILSVAVPHVPEQES